MSSFANKHLSLLSLLLFFFSQPKYSFKNFRGLFWLLFNNELIFFLDDLSFHYSFQCSLILFSIFMSSGWTEWRRGGEERREKIDEKEKVDKEQWKKKKMKKYVALFVSHYLCKFAHLYSICNIWKEIALFSFFFF